MVVPNELGSVEAGASFIRVAARRLDLRSSFDLFGAAVWTPSTF
jgi:hypothetical protein